MSRSAAARAVPGIRPLPHGKTRSRCHREGCRAFKQHPEELWPRTFARRLLSIIGPKWTLLVNRTSPPGFRPYPDGWPGIGTRAFPEAPYEELEGQIAFDVPAAIPGCGDPLEEDRPIIDRGRAGPPRELPSIPVPCFRRDSVAEGGALPDRRRETRRSRSSRCGFSRMPSRRQRRTTPGGDGAVQGVHRRSERTGREDPFVEG